MSTSGPLIAQPAVNPGLFFWAGVPVIVSHAHEEMEVEESRRSGWGLRGHVHEEEWSWWSSAWTPQ